MRRPPISKLPSIYKAGEVFQGGLIIAEGSTYSGQWMVVDYELGERIFVRLNSPHPFGVRGSSIARIDEWVGYGSMRVVLEELP